MNDESKIGGGPAFGDEFDYLMEITGPRFFMDYTSEYKALLPKDYNIWDRFSADAQDSLAGYEPNPDRATFVLSAWDLANLPDYAIGKHDFPMIVSTRFKALVERFAVPCVEFGPARVELTSEAYYERGEGEQRSGVFVEGYWWMHHWLRLDLMNPWATEALWGPSKVKVPIGQLPPPGSYKDFIPGFTEFMLTQEYRIRFKTQHVEGDFFGVKYWRQRRFVSPKFRKAIEAEGLRVRFHQRPLWLLPHDADRQKKMRWFGTY